MYLRDTFIQSDKQYKNIRKREVLFTWYTFGPDQILDPDFSTYCTLNGQSSKWREKHIVCLEQLLLTGGDLQCGQFSMCNKIHNPIRGTSTFLVGYLTVFLFYYIGWKRGTLYHWWYKWGNHWHTLLNKHITQIFSSSTEQLCFLQDVLPTLA